MPKVIVNIVGARPNFMKIAPLMREYSKHKNLKPIIIHTGQHYDKNLSEIFFQELGIPKPNIHLGVNKGSNLGQISKNITRLEKHLISLKPDLLVVVGDTNAALSGTLAAKALKIPLAHIEAGLRSFDMSMPEEINRIITDRLSDLLFVTEKSGLDNLKKEGIKKEKVFLTGNIMIDSLKYNLNKTKSQNSKIPQRPFVVITLHRPSNVDSQENLNKIVSIIQNIKSFNLDILFPLHPRTKKNIKKFNLYKFFSQNTILVPPLGYLEFIGSIKKSKLILTDSGGIQEEASWLNIPVLTMRENTERPITITLGTNTLVGLNEEKILKNIKKIQKGKYKKAKPIPLWDGNSAQRIVKYIKEFLT